MHRLTTLSKNLLLPTFVGLTVCLCVTAGCGQSVAPERRAAAPSPTPGVDLSVGATVRDVRDAMVRWSEFTSKHPTCYGIVTIGCVTQEERARVAVALNAYARARGDGARSSADDKQDTPEAIRASRDYCVAVADAIERQR